MKRKEIILWMALFILLILPLCVFAGLSVANVGAAGSRSETLYTASGGVLGYIDNDSGGYQVVRDKSKKVLGYVNSRGTYNTSKRKILKSRLPGYLFCK